MSLQPDVNNPVAREHQVGHNLFNFHPAALGDGSIRVHYRDRNVRGKANDMLPGNSFLVTFDPGFSTSPRRTQSWIVVQKEIAAKVAALDTSFRAGFNGNGQMVIAVADELNEKKPVISGDALLELFAGLEETIKTPEDVQKLLAEQQDRETKCLAKKHEHERQTVQNEQGGWVAATSERKANAALVSQRG